VDPVIKGVIPVFLAANRTGSLNWWTDVCGFRENFRDATLPNYSGINHGEANHIAGNSGWSLKLFVFLARKYCICFSLLLALLPQAARSQSDAWLQLFNAKDLAGWQHVGRAKYTAENGLLRTHGGSGVLYWGEGSSETA
jgi:hypothetical protein